MSKTITDPNNNALWKKSLELDAALDGDGLAELWHPDGSVQIGANPRVTGRDAIRGFFNQFFAAGLFTKLEHQMREVYEQPEVLIYEADAIYTLPSGDELRVPYTNVVRHRDGLFFDYRVYIDTSPLMAHARG